MHCRRVNALSRSFPYIKFYFGRTMLCKAYFLRCLGPGIQGMKPSILITDEPARNRATSRPYSANNSSNQTVTNRTKRTVDSIVHMIGYSRPKLCQVYPVLQSHSAVTSWNSEDGVQVEQPYAASDSSLPCCDINAALAAGQ